MSKPEVVIQTMNWLLQKNTIIIMGRTKGAKNRPKPVSDFHSDFHTAWEQYKTTDDYRSVADALTHVTYTPQQPYVDNVIQRIYSHAYWQVKKTIGLKNTTTA